MTAFYYFISDHPVNYFKESFQSQVSFPRDSLMQYGKKNIEVLEENDQIASDMLERFYILQL